MQLIFKVHQNYCFLKKKREKKERKEGREREGMNEEGGNKKEKSQQDILT